MSRAVLDENAPKRLAMLLREHGMDVSAFPNAWKGLSNGRLLDRVEQSGFAVLLTCDQSITAQQNMRGRAVGLVVLGTNDVPHLARHLDLIGAAIRSVSGGGSVRIDIPAG